MRLLNTLGERPPTAIRGWGRPILSHIPIHKKYADSNWPLLTNGPKPNLQNIKKRSDHRPSGVCHNLPSEPESAEHSSSRSAAAPFPPKFVDFAKSFLCQVPRWPPCSLARERNAEEDDEAIVGYIGTESPLVDAAVVDLISFVAAARTLETRILTRFRRSK